MLARQNYDVIFIGGGLAASLSALFLREERPDIDVLIIEAQNDFDSKASQTWSFQSLPANVDPSTSKLFSNLSENWLGRLVSKSWEAYDVYFPEFHRRLDIPYHSLRSKDLWSYLAQELKESILFGVKVVACEDKTLLLSNGQKLRAKHVFDSRGWENKAFPVAGYQKFVGLNVRLKAPHGLTEPILMDARVDQKDGFRFMYTLPWDDYHLLIEDTHYSDDSRLDFASYQAEILAYAASNSWQIEAIEESEQGALALPAFSRESFVSSKLGESLPQIGVRAGLFHATTGYSIYDAVLSAELIVNSLDLSSNSLGEHFHYRNAKHWEGQEFYRRLNNMLFFAAEADQRYRVLERFYEHDQDLISRFYAGRTNARDKIRIMSGRPPIPMKKAIYHFFNRNEVRHG